MENRINYLQEQEMQIEKDLQNLNKQFGELAGKSEARHEFVDREFKETHKRLDEIISSSKDRDNKLDVNLKCLTEILNNQQKQLDKQESVIDQNSEDINDLKAIVATITKTELKLNEMEQRIAKLESHQEENLDIKKTRISGF